MSSIRTFSLCLVTAGLAAAAQDRVVAPVDSARTVTLSGHLHPSAQARFDEGPVDAAMPVPIATLYLKPAAGLENFLSEQQTPSSLNYHRWLTPEQFGDRFGVTTADLAKLQSWLASQGLQVRDSARGRHWITFSGTAGTVGRAFRTQLHRYRVNGQVHFANSTAISIPAAFETVVAGVDGLHDFLPQPLLIKAADQPLNNSATTSNHFLAPDDLATIYDIAPLYTSGIDGTGQKIAVIGQSAIQLSDIRQFRKQFNLAAKDPQVMLFGPDPGTSANSKLEADADLEWSGAVARNADLLFVYAQSASIAATYAVDQNLAPVMTFSFGNCELEGNTGFRAVAQQANAQGITWFAGSGDWGSATCDLAAPTPQATKGATVSMPASFPEITAVGGSEFNDGGAGFWAVANNANGASALSYIPEKAWNDSSASNSLEATGGGPSGFFAKPLWQTGPGVPNDNARDIPDVSLPSSPRHYGYIVVSGGSQIIVGGTSLSTPAWAGIAALLEQNLAAANPGAAVGLGNINPVLYRLAQSTTDVFHDITSGDNKVSCQQGSPGCVGGLVGFSAGAGYDLATGLGSVDVNQFVKEWNTGRSTTTSLTASPAQVSLTDTVQLKATVAGSGGAAPTGTVTFLSNDTAIGSAQLTASADGTTGAAPIAVAGVLVASGPGSVSAVYSGDGVYDASSGTASISLNLPASGSLVTPFVSPNPVYKNGTNNNWSFTVTLSEKAGVGATLTNFSIGSNNDTAFFNSSKIPASGSISTALSSTGLTPPVNRVFTFTGTDDAGLTWTRQITVPFLDTPGASIAPAMSLTSPLSTVEQNPQADPSCQWSQPLVLQELGGFEITLTGFTVGGANQSSQLQQLFGTQRLAPFGMLRGVYCYPSTTTPTNKAYIVTGASELGSTMTTSLNTPLVAAPAASAAFTASPASINLPGGSSTVNLSFDGGSPKWAASVSPANRTSNWLTVSPASGSGNGQLTVQASSDGLSDGVYNAVVNIQAGDAVPQSIGIPVTFQVGQAGNTTISGLQNAFSFHDGFAPGMSMSVYGTNLAGATIRAPGQFPLPLALGGVSVTVNGISAPLFYVSPGQINVQVPYETGAGPAVLAVNNNGQIASIPFTVAPVAPGLYASAISNNTGLPVNSAKQGQLLLLFMTGEGDVTPSLASGATPSATITDPTRLPHARQAVAVTVGGVTAPVLFAGIPSGVAGLTQINFNVPVDAPTGAQPVIVTVGGIASLPITLNIVAGQ